MSAACRTDYWGDRGAVCAPPSLVGQTSAALITTSLENLSAVGGSHSLAEAMFLASLSLLRLICSEHMHTSFSLLLPINFC